MKLIEIGLYILGWVFLTLAFNYEAHHMKKNMDYKYCDGDCYRCEWKKRCRAYKKFMEGKRG